jgi:hypothetical protein
VILCISAAALLGILSITGLCLSACPSRPSFDTLRFFFLFFSVGSAFTIPNTGSEPQPNLAVFNKLDACFIRNAGFVVLFLSYWSRVWCALFLS